MTCGRPHNIITCTNTHVKTNAEYCGGSIECTSFQFKQLSTRPKAEKFSWNRFRTREKRRIDRTTTTRTRRGVSREHFMGDMLNWTHAENFQYRLIVTAVAGAAVVWPFIAIASICWEIAAFSTDGEHWPSFQKIKNMCIVSVGFGFGSLRKRIITEREGVR